MLLFVLILVISLLLQLMLPWWIIALVAFGLAAWKGSSDRQAWLAGFAAIFVGWAVAAWIPHIRNEGILTAKIAELFYLPTAQLVIWITALVGGMIGGIAAWSGYCWRRVFVSKL